MEQWSILDTVAIIAAIFMVARAIRGGIAANTVAIAELRGALLAHIGGNSQAPGKIAATGWDKKIPEIWNFSENLV